MSVQGLALRQQTQAKVYRGTAGQNPDGTTYLGAPWTLELSGVRGWIEGVGETTVAKVFGTHEVVEAIALIAPVVDVAREDRLVVTDGPFAGRTFRVVEVKPHRYGTASDHLECAVQSTTETIP